VAQKLFEAGYNAFPILPSGAPKKAARLRFSIKIDHRRDDISSAISHSSVIHGGRIPIVTRLKACRCFCRLNVFVRSLVLLDSLWRRVF
jgi:hypothetical protein